MKTPTCLNATRNRQILLLLGWVLILAALFAELEIQIEGARGWAAGLPTWRMNDAPVIKLFFGGREVTGYHVFAFTFMFCVFHLPLAMLGQFSARLEARILGSLMLFWIIEDFLWFVMNPAYGLPRFRPDCIPWHRVWLLGLPQDYLVFTLAGLILIAWSYWVAWRSPRPREAARAEARRT